MSRQLAAAVLFFFTSFGANAMDHFAQSSHDLGEILKNKVFTRYNAWKISAIRGGEIGPSNAFFVRLIKPGPIIQKGVCIEFVNENGWKVHGQPYACEDF